MFVAQNPGSKISYKNVDVSDNKFLLRMKAAPRLFVEGVRNLVTRVLQLVFSATFPERAFWVLLPALSRFDVGTVGSRSPAR